MPGVVELRLGALYHDGGEPPPPPGSSASIQPYQVREFEVAVRAAMRAGRVTLEDGREELRLLRLCREAFGSKEGPLSIPVTIAPAEKQFPIRGGRGKKSEATRQKKARRKNRRPKKRKR